MEKLDTHKKKREACFLCNRHLEKKTSGLEDRKGPPNCHLSSTQRPAIQKPSCVQLTIPLSVLQERQAILPSLKDQKYISDRYV